MDTDKLGQVIYEKALACGFDDCGIIPIDDMDGFQQRLQEREEKVPSSAFFYQGMGDFANIKKRFPWAKSVIIGTYWLGKYRFPPSLQGKYGKAFFLSPSNSVCKESLTARRDFETWFKEQGIRCEGGGQFGHPSIGPLRYAAMMAGLGIIRKRAFFLYEKRLFCGAGGICDRPEGLVSSCTGYTTLRRKLSSMSNPLSQRRPKRTVYHEPAGMYLFYHDLCQRRTHSGAE